MDKGLNHFSLLFKALGDDSRLRILSLIKINGEMCGVDLEQVLEFTQTKTSRHLSYLKNAGLLKSRKVDQWTFYKVEDHYKEMVASIFKQMEEVKSLSEDLETFTIMKSNRVLAINKLENKRYFAP